MIIIGLILTLLGALWFAYLFVRTNKRLRDLKSNIEERIAAERSMAIASSKSTMRGQISEHIIPLFPDFPYNLGYCKFMGAPLDYIVFNGMDGILEDIEGAKMDIILAEVKTGQSQLSKIQRAIKKAVKEGRVRFETWNIDADNKIKIKEG